MNPANYPEAGILKFLALGDSYTIGESVAEADRFPNQAIQRLYTKGFRFAAPPRIIATTGWTTRNLLDAITTSGVAGLPPYDAVTLLIGVNNQYQGRDTGEYRIQFTECLDKAIQLSGHKPAHVFVLSIPDWSVTPYAANFDRAKVATEIDLFNTINREITLAKGIAYINITPISRQPDPALVAGDGLHPSGKQYGLWADSLAAVMERGLNR